MRHVNIAGLITADYYINTSTRQRILEPKILDNHTEQPGISREENSRVYVGARSSAFNRLLGDTLESEPRKFALSDEQGNNQEPRKTWLILTAKSRRALLPPSSPFFRGPADPTTFSTFGGRARSRCWGPLCSPPTPLLLFSP